MTLDEQQKKAAKSAAPVTVCIAGPGSGKSATIVERVLAVSPDQYDHGEKFPSIIAVTYTNAAAKELSDRIRESLCDESVWKPTYCGTLHGLMLRHLMTHGTKIGLKPKLVVIDDARKDQLIEELIEDKGITASKKEVEDLIEKGWFRNSLPSMNRVKSAAHEYHKKCREYGIVDYDTILEYGFDLLHKVPMECDHLLIDEYQDASFSDADIYGMIKAEHKFYCGDPDQSCFSFRKADVKCIMHMAKSVAEVHVLENNYRCPSNVCKHANLLIAHNKDRVSKETKPIKQGGKVGHREFSDANEEQLTISQHIANGLKARPDHTFAVIVRTNELVRQFTDALQSQLVQCEQDVVNVTPQLADATAYVSLMADPDNDALARWFLEARHGKKRTHEIVKDALKCGRSLNDACLKVPQGMTVSKALEFLHVKGEFRSVMQTVEDVASELPTGASLQEFALALAEVKSHRMTQEHEAKVSVVTYHRAKGREWSYVFLPAFEQGVIPSKQSMNDPVKMEEERRLAFVGMTRCSDSLAITSARTRFDKWTKRIQPCEPSQFLKEAGL